jgi:hypothetical protein
LLVDDGEVRDGLEELLKLCEERDTVTVRLSEGERIPAVGEETVMTVDGERGICCVHRNDLSLAQIASALRETSLITV